MGIRDALENNRRVTVGVVSAIVLLVVAVTLWPSREGTGESTTPKAFFTDDDGATFFTDDASKLPPFDHHGKKANGCWVYQDSGGRKFVALIYRYTDEEKKRREQQGQQAGKMDPRELNQDPREFKKPGTGDAGWLKASDPRAIELLRPPVIPGQPNPVMVSAE